MGTVEQDSQGQSGVVLKTRLQHKPTVEKKQPSAVQHSTAVRNSESVKCIGGVLGIFSSYLLAGLPFFRRFCMLARTTRKYVSLTGKAGMGREREKREGDMEEQQRGNLMGRRGKQGREMPRYPAVFFLTRGHLHFLSICFCFITHTYTQLWIVVRWKLL